MYHHLPADDSDVSTDEEPLLQANYNEDSSINVSKCRNCVGETVFCAASVERGTPLIGYKIQQKPKAAFSECDIGRDIEMNVYETEVEIAVDGA